MTMLVPPPPALAADVETIRRYRERHTIEPRVAGLAGIRIHVCKHDGIRVDPVRGGWRHDSTEVATLSRRTAGYA